ncbi:MAG TPA: FAD-dependent oxidoreductase [Kofleriaceae bacterium]|nr:FAD-dependent oxidoreductase [Kofleriaceae bacterium]
MQITVVGAGVTGLVTALTLQERGHDVQVVTAATGEAITSSVAGACWFPYRAGPPDRVAAWAAETRAWLTTLAAEPGARDAGVAVITGYEITEPPPGDAPPWWAAHITVDRAPAPVTGAPLAWRYGSLGIEPARFLPWLARRLARPIEHRAVTDLDAEPGDLVVHCTGLAAHALTGDRELQPLLGQVVITEPGAIDGSFTVTDERDPAAMFYLIPRSRELVLGGCSIPWPADAPLPDEDPALTARILAQAAALGLAVGPVKRVRLGLRPYRPEIRLERTGRVIHNYGHGGAGYTLCRGCAEAVAALATA